MREVPQQASEALPVVKSRLHSPTFKESKRRRKLATSPVGVEKVRSNKCPFACVHRTRLVFLLSPG